MPKPKKSGSNSCPLGNATATRVTGSLEREGRSHPQRARPAVATRAPSSNLVDRVGRPVGRTARVKTFAVPLLPAFASAAENSATVENRSAGNFASAVSTAFSTSGGTVSRRVCSGAGRSVSTFATMACALEPVKGGSPASISYVMAPNAYTSVRASTVLSPIACSGLM